VLEGRINSLCLSVSSEFTEPTRIQAYEIQLLRMNELRPSPGHTPILVNGPPKCTFLGILASRIAQPLKIAGTRVTKMGALR